MSWGVNTEEMCRACMRVDVVLLPMYEGQLGNKNLPLKLAELASIQIDKEDGLPSKLCAKCAYRTDAFYDFKTQVQATEVKLRKIFKEGRPSIKSEPQDDHLYLQVDMLQEVGKTEAMLEFSEEDNEESSYARDSIQRVSPRENDHSEASPDSEFQDTFSEETQNTLRDSRIVQTNGIEDVSKLGDSEYAIVYMPNESRNSLLSETDSYVFIGPENTQENVSGSSNSSALESKSCEEESSVTYEAKSERLAFYLGKVVEGEDSESENGPKPDKVVGNALESEEEDSDYFADPKDNILGSLNDTIIKIKEIRTGNNGMNYQCTLCMQNYEQLTGALNHIVDNHVPATGPFFCTVCEKDCESRRDLRSHVKLHTGALPYVCFICDKAYSVKRYLKRHMVSHTEFFRHRCPKCGQRFKMKSELETHVTSHIRGSPYACSQCTRVFNHKGNYKRHLITHLDPHGLHLPKFPCKVCGKRFLNNRTLETHLRVHTGEKPFQCDTCLKSFSQQGNLLNHMRIHSNPRSYTCEVCGKQFNQRSTLKDHSLLHTGEKPYVCTVCGIAFTFSAALRRHMWTHANGKPYGCEICDARFVGKYDLKRHMAIHSDRPRSRKRRNQTQKEEDFVFHQPAADEAGNAASTDNTETILIEQVLLNQDVTQVVTQEESEKENVDALFTLIQYGE